MREHIICYDICCPKRLGKVFRRLRQEAISLQYSVFLFSGNAQQLEKLLFELAGYIKRQEDDLRAYSLPARGFKVRVGKPSLPTGILYSCLPTSW